MTYYQCFVRSASKSITLHGSERGLTGRQHNPLVKQYGEDGFSESLGAFQGLSQQEPVSSGKRSYLLAEQELDIDSKRSARDLRLIILPDFSCQL